MATLVLTAVGTAIGGPIGGLIGAVVGQQADQKLFAPKARQGPRLGDLSVQTSAYGAAIPKIFGRMRVAGTVIWSTDLIESRSTSGGGKGRPRVVSYNYSASFAVALSARPIRAVHRIWADGKLLRGAAGDFKSATGFRLHIGDEDQTVDPLIASAEGVDQTPAFRGLAYAVFENLRLEDFGNRIPSLTFEVEADPESVAIGRIAEELSAGEIQAEATPAVTGYAAGGDSVRSAVEALADIVPLSLSDRDAQLVLRSARGAAVALGADEESGHREILRRGAGSVPEEVSLTYYDPERDFQTGLQRATTGAASRPRLTETRALAAALTADAAKGLAEHRLAALRAGRVSGRLQLGWARGALRPGDAVRLDGEAGLWRIRRWQLGAMTLTLELSRLPGAGDAPASANSGRPVREPDLPHGPTILYLFDLPLGEPRGAQPLLFAVAAGEEPGWRRAELLSSFDGGTTWTEAGSTAAPAVIGTALTTLEAGPSTLFDTGSDLEVELVNSGMWLENASDDDLVAGANLTAVGNELIQFGQVEWLGERRFRLSRLLRGRRGTEWAADGHAAGEAFAIIERDRMLVLEAPPESVGAEVRLSASGVGDGEAVTAEVLISAEALRPPSPVHVSGQRLANDDVLIRWVRRSRQGWSWPSGGATPLAEEREAYRLVIAGGASERIVTTAQPEYLYTAAEQASDGVAGAIELSVVQVGTHAASRPALRSLSI